MADDPQDISRVVDRPVLVTGATGYVGGRLAARLEKTGLSMRCMAREPSRLRGRLGPAVEVVRGDVAEPERLEAALDGVDTAFFLIHALAGGRDFEEAELRGARNFADAVRSAGVPRIVYLGGLGDTGDETSAHMRSRHAVGKALRDSGVQVIEFRASIIIGPGSLSFELIRSLVRRLPVMLVPRWVRVRAQPIYIDDVLDYLVEALSLPGSDSQVYEIGGADQLSYLELMKCYGEMTGLKRVYINVPFLTPWLSSLWLNLVTPLFATVGRKLIDSIRIASVVRDDRALRDFGVRPRGVESALRAALDAEDETFAQTHWADALSSAPSARSYGGLRYGSRVVDSRVVTVGATPQAAFAVVERIGGDTGWYYADWLWSVRGFIDRLAGGVGMQRGRRHPTCLRVGDAVDCWRVEAIERPRRLLLRAEMNVWGRAWLQFEVYPDGEATTIRQTAVYDPHGLTGLAYWYSLYLLHELVFSGMLRGIARATGARANARKASPIEDNLPGRES